MTTKFRPSVSLLLPILLLTTCCGQREPELVFESPELSSLTSRIEKRAAEVGCQLHTDYIASVSFDQIPKGLGSGVVGVCVWAIVGGVQDPSRSFISLDKAFWKPLTRCQKEMILTHEWAHCGLTIREHATTGLMSLTPPMLEDAACEAEITRWWAAEAKVKCK
jgi:hypothetical protein